MKLLSEDYFTNVKVLVEEKQGKKDYYIEGVFLQSELKNRNGRFYRKPLLEREVNRYTKDYINTGRAVGELGHPDSPNINYDRACHKILSLREDGNNWLGRSKILSTPMGGIVKNLIDDEVTFGVSSRGMGSLKDVNEMKLVEDDYHLATPADIVYDPSAPDAFVRSIREGKEWVWNNGIITESVISDMNDEIRRAKAKDIEEVSLKIFENFLSRL